MSVNALEASPLRRPAPWFRRQGDGGAAEEAAEREARQGAAQSIWPLTHLSFPPPSLRVAFSGVRERRRPEGLDGALTPFPASGRGEAATMKPRDRIRCQAALRRREGLGGQTGEEEGERQNSIAIILQRDVLFRRVADADVARREIDAGNPQRGEDREAPTSREQPRSCRGRGGRREQRRRAAQSRAWSGALSNGVPPRG